MAEKREQAGSVFHNRERSSHILRRTVCSQCGVSARTCSVGRQAFSEGNQEERTGSVSEMNELGPCSARIQLCDLMGLFQGLRESNYGKDLGKLGTIYIYKALL